MMEYCVNVERSSSLYYAYFANREFLKQEEDMEKVLTKAFLEIDKAFARQAHQSVDGTFSIYIDQKFTLGSVWETMIR